MFKAKNKMLPDNNLLQLIGFPTLASNSPLFFKFTNTEKVVTCHQYLSLVHSFPIHLLYNNSRVGQWTMQMQEVTKIIRMGLRTIY